MRQSGKQTALRRQGALLSSPGYMEAIRVEAAESLGEPVGELKRGLSNRK